MPHEEIEIDTPDGRSPASVHVPEGSGPWPGVIMYPDAGGLRDVLRGMASRLAAAGYVVLVPDFFYRSPGWAPFDVATLFTDDAERARLGSMASVLTPDVIASDADAWSAYLLSREDVAGPAIGTTGYCMGGRMSLIAATRLGDRIAAAASFHGGRIAVEGDPESPHAAADGISATVYVAGAIEDGSYTGEQAALLESALTAAGVEHTLETYPAHHGFSVPDNPTYDEAAAGRHYAATQSLFAARL